MTASYGPCERWPVRWTCDVSGESPTATGIAVDVATEVVWALSGRRFGQCEVKLRPCRAWCLDGYYPIGQVYPLPVLRDGLWYNVGCGTCITDGCDCTPRNNVVRLHTPVNEVVEVMIDGSPVVTGGYRLYDDRLLYLTEGTWPECNDLDLADTEVGTWSITVAVGEAVPTGGEVAVGEFACEVLKALRGEDCRLPRTVTQLARQGVTISLPDVSEMFANGRTGLFLVDAFIAAHNPRHLTRRARVYSVDGPRHRREST